jgi:hypothetical protein
MKKCNHRNCTKNLNRRHGNRKYCSNRCQEYEGKLRKKENYANKKLKKTNSINLIVTNNQYYIWTELAKKNKKSINSYLVNCITSFLNKEDFSSSSKLNSIYKMLIERQAYNNNLSLDEYIDKLVINSLNIKEDDILYESVNSLNLSKRTLTILNQMFIVTIKDLVDNEISDFDNVKNFGQKSKYELENCINELNDILKNIKQKNNDSISDTVIIDKEEDSNVEGVAKAEPKKGLFSFLKNIFK